MKKNLKSVISFVVALALSLSSFAALAATTFDDVPADATYAEAVANLTAIGIVEGYGDGKFNPENKITRAEVAAMIIRALAQNDAALSSKGATNFTDVAADHWASGYVNVASRGSSAFINGMGDGTFAPEANVTYAQVVKMLVAGIGYGDWGVAKGGYPTGYIATAKDLGITNGVASINADEQATRAVVAQLINNAIDTPLLQLKTYSPTNPEYVIMDGNNDNDYQTILTYNHGIYKVEGRVTTTNKTDSSAVNADEVQFQIEVTKNYNDDLVAKRTDDKFNTFKMYVGDTDAADYLDVYAKALVKVDADDEATILSFVASGKNVTTTLDADAFDDEKFGATSADELLKGDDKGQIWYYSSSEKTGKSSRYYVSKDFKLYVNGVEYKTVDAEAVEKYIFNTTGTVTLVDSPKAGEVTTDGKYDSIFVSYYGTGIVDSVSANGKVYFKQQSQDIKTNIEFDDDDEDKTYSIKLDGKEISYTDLKEDDVLSIAYDVTGGKDTFVNSNFYEVKVSREVVEGQVNEANKEDAEIYINDTYYKTIEDTNFDVEAENFVLGTSYKVLVDAFGRIVYKEKLATTVKYGIVYRAYEDTNTDEKTVVIYDTTATAKTFVVRDDSQAEKAFDAGLTTAKDNNNAQACVVEYEVHSSGELKTITYLDSIGGANQTYKKSGSKIGSLKFNDSTVMIYADGNDYSVVKASSLVDEQSYTAYGYDREDSVYNFVVITEGIGEYTTDTRFAVVDKIVTSTNSVGDNCHKLSVYVAGSTDLQVVATEDVDVAEGVAKGDVVVYKLNANGDIDEITVLFDNPGSFVNYAVENKGDFSSLFAENPWDSDEDVELVFGPVVSKSSSGVSIGKVASKDNLYSYADRNSKKDPLTALVTNIDDTEELSYASNVAIYVYDYNNSNSTRLSVGNSSSVPKTTVGNANKLYDDKANEYIDWNGTETPDYSYAFAKVVEDEVTDLFVIIPKDN